MAWIVIGIILILVVGVWLIEKGIEILGLTTNRLSVAIFGRKRSGIAKLIEPPEFVHDLLPEPSDDLIVQKLNQWKPETIRFPSPSWPKWQSLWITDWITEKIGSNSATTDDIELLFR